MIIGSSTQCIVLNALSGTFSTQSILYCDGSKTTFSGGCEQYLGNGVYQPILCSNTPTNYVCRKNAACSKIFKEQIISIRMEKGLETIKEILLLVKFPLKVNDVKKPNRVNNDNIC